MALAANLLLVGLSLILGLRLLRQYLVKPRAHTLWYSVGLLLTALASLPEVYRGLTGGLPVVLWWTYWVAASALVGFLATGTAYLLSAGLGRSALVGALILTAALVVTTIATAGQAPVSFTAETFTKAPTVAIKVPFLIQNIAGALLIFGGALWSWIKTRGLFAVLIALGTLIFTAGGASSGLLKYSSLFYFTQTAGILVLYAGVSLSMKPIKARRAAA